VTKKNIDTKLVRNIYIKYFNYEDHYMILNYLNKQWNIQFFLRGRRVSPHTDTYFYNVFYCIFIYTIIMFNNLTYINYIHILVKILCKLYNLTT